MGMRSLQRHMLDTHCTPNLLLLLPLVQVMYNCRRRSTQGWSILNILLDFMGGALSMGQQLLTCWWAGNWAPVTANPVKLGLALTSMLMDLVFMLQHYVLYAGAARRLCEPLCLPAFTGANNTAGAVAVTVAAAAVTAVAALIC